MTATDEGAGIPRDGGLDPARIGAPAEPISPEQRLAQVQQIDAARESGLPSFRADDTDPTQRSEVDTSQDPVALKSALGTTSGSSDSVPQRQVAEQDPEGIPFQEAFDNNTRAADAELKSQKTGLKEGLKRHLLDDSAAVKDALTTAGAKDAVIMRTLVSGASSAAKHEYSLAEKRIYKGVPRRDEKAVAQYIVAKRVVETSEIMRERGTEEFDHPSGMTEQNARALVAEVEGDPRNAHIVGASGRFWDEMRGSLDKLRDNGLISQEAHQSLTDNHRFYSPRQFVQFIDSKIGGGGKGELDSGVKELTTGSEGAMNSDPRSMLAQVKARTESRVFKNKANIALLDTARNSPENGVVRTLGKGVEPKLGESEVIAFENGQPVRMAMPKKLAAEWNKTPPGLQRDVAEILKWVTGVKLVKAGATTFNPTFFISNMPRDMQHAWLTSGEYSTFLPKAVTQQLGDIGSVWKDAFGRKGLYSQYLRAGGGMDFLSTESKVRANPWDKNSRTKTAVAKVADVVTHLNETSELVMRLAVMKRGMERGLSAEEAVYNARNMLDFAQGGKTAKAADVALPYLNAAIQGTRSTLRQFAGGPKSKDFQVATLKSAQLVAVGYAMAHSARAIMGDDYDAISEKEKATKWIIPLPFKIKDKDGHTRRAYLAIAKDQGQQIFSAIGQSASDIKAGKPWGNQTIAAMSQLMPADLGSNIPQLAAYQAYFRNYDSWRNQKIWQGDPDTSPNMERKLTTRAMATGISDAAKNIGIDVSPERMSVAASKLIPPQNPVVSIGNDMVDAISGKTADDTLVELTRRTPGIRRLLRWTRPLELTESQAKKAKRFDVETEGRTPFDVGRETSKLSTERADLRAQLNLDSDKIVSDIRSGSATTDDLRRFILEQSKGEQVRLRSRIKRRDAELGATISSGGASTRSRSRRSRYTPTPRR